MRTILPAALLFALPLLCAQTGAPAGTNVPMPSGTPTTQPTPPAHPLSGKLGTPVDLFNGKDLTGWSWHADDASKIEDVWTVKDGILHCAKGKKGYIRLDKEYANFVLTVEQRHVAPGNGGFFVCMFGPDKVWPDGVQIQGKSAAIGDLINQNSSMKKIVTDPARTKTVNKDVLITRIGPNNEKPVGEWNTIEATVDHGNLTVKVNGQLQNWATDLTPATGKIAIQDEGVEMEFRKFTLTPIE
jgi:hypothetical protein